MTTGLGQLPPQVAATLRAFARRKRALCLLRLMAVLVIVYLALVLLSTHIDRFIFMSVEARRALMWGVHGFAALTAVIGATWLATRRWSWRQIAYEVEAELGGRAGERLVTLENLAARGGAIATAPAAGGDLTLPAGSAAKDLAAALEHSAIELTQHLHAGKLVRDPIARRLSWIAGGLVVVMIALGAWRLYQLPLMVERFYFPQRDLPRASFIDLQVTGDQPVLGVGAEAVIQARVVNRTPMGLGWLMDLMGASPRGCVISVMPATTADGNSPFGSRAAASTTRPTTQSATQPVANLANSPSLAAMVMPATPGAPGAPGVPGAPGAPIAVQRMMRVQRDLFLFNRPDVRESFAYRLRCGNAETATHVVRVAAQPRIIESRLVATPPAYSGLPPITVSDPSEATTFLAGTRIALSFRTDQPVVRRTLRFGKSAKPIEPQWDEMTRTAGYEWTLKDPASVEIEVANELGFSNVERVAWRIGVREDQPPTVRLEEPGPELEAVAGSLLELRGQVEDDLGVMEMAVRFVLNPDPNRESMPRDLPLAMEKPNERHVALAGTLDLDKTGAAAGDVVQMQVRARDARGGDGLSRAVTVRVVPLARGADEHRRIAGLRATSRALEALAAAATQPSPPAVSSADWSPQATRMDADAYRAIAKWASERGVPMREEPTAASVLVMLENEHYLTADPRHQEDMRMIYGLVQYLTTRAFRKPGEQVESRRNRMLELRSIIDVLADYRQSRNLMWRFFGLRDEAARLSEMLSALMEIEKPSEESMNRMNRRCALYLTALQDAGAELIESSKRIDAATGEKATQLVGAMNETGYFITRGAIGRRRSSARQVSEQMTSALELLRSLLPALVDREVRARKWLEVLDQSAQVSVATGRANAEAQAWWRMQGRLLDRQPMAPLWPRAVALSVSQGMAKTLRAEASEREVIDAARQQAARAMILTSDGPDLDLVAQDSVMHGYLAQEWRLATARRLTGVSESERQAEIALAEMEDGGNIGAFSPEMVRYWAKVLARVPLSPSATQPTATAVSATQEAREAFGGVRIDCRQRYRSIAQAARQRIDSAPWRERLGVCVERATAVEAALQQATEAMEQGQGDPTATARKLAQALSDELTALSVTVDAMALDLCLLPGAFDGKTSGDASKTATQATASLSLEASDGALVQLRELSGRYEQRIAPALAALESALASGAALSAQQLGDIKVQLPRLKAVHEALRVGLVRLRQPVATQPAGAVHAPSWLTRSAMLAGPWLRVTDATSSEEMIAWLSRLPGGAGALLAGRAGEAASARQAIVEAQELFAGVGEAGKSVNEVRLRDTLTLARAALAKVQDAVKLAGSERTPPGVAAALSAALAEVSRLPGVGAGSGGGGGAMDGQTLARWRMALPECDKRLAALERALKAESASREESEPEFRGGPAGAWSEETRFEGQAARRRLIEMWRWSNDEAVAAVAAGALSRPDGATADRGYAMAALGYRMARSSLAGSGGAQAATRPTGATADPFVEFLRGELSKAKQRQKQLTDYVEPTRAYLDSVGDYLRY